ncbi:MocR-like pyridoxine biosynthesis transcription factor PdxR [Candidatus Solirubrobacter pratensis]|uniref:MocR-like pyridoxine biosynthesis transcription factor PdxR n=1 Tax=Candidatus Solirubrobacter pratensis TaxID=1298857 RepID=UPI000404FDEC|nr:PLP-dependent aminotransferase family protein [Candidatus Solirubrobacter pratensis]
MNRATELFTELDRGNGTPLRAQLEHSVCDAIAGGGLRPGDRLPASRLLAEAAGVSRGVVSEAYAQLAAEGWIEIRRGRAPVVRAEAVAAPLPRRGRAEAAGPSSPARPRLDLTATAPDLARFPRRAWMAGTRRALAAMPDAALDYADPRGDEELRTVLAAYLVRVCGVAAAPERVVVTGGYTQGLWLACRALARRGARRVAVEDPSLDDSRATIRSAGLELVGVPVDGDGARIDPRLDADAFLVTPAHQFPTGALLSPERRRALLAWAAEGDRHVLEDDYDSEYAYDSPPVRTLQRLAPERVIYLGTASKTLAPALRMGWMAAPAELVEPIAAERWAVDSGGPAIAARAFAAMLAAGEVDRHIRRTRREYHLRRDRLVAALRERLPDCRVEGQSGGLHLLLRLPPGADEDAAVAALEQRRIRIRGLAGYRLAALEEAGAAGSPAGDGPALVVGYGRLPLASIDAVADALRDAIGAAG